MRTEERPARRSAARRRSRVPVPLRSRAAGSRPRRTPRRTGRRGRQRGRCVSWSGPDSTGGIEIFLHGTPAGEVRSCPREEDEPVGTVLVVVIAVAVGVLVYRLTAGGAEPTSPAEPPLPGTDDEIGAWTSGEGGVTRSALA